MQAPVVEKLRREVTRLTGEVERLEKEVTRQKTLRSDPAATGGIDRGYD
jgi:hypothetical protein